MKLSLFLIILVGPCCCFMTNQLLQYHFINETKSWDEAQKYCRANHTDLATVRSMADMKKLNQDLGSKKAWIGLYREANSKRMWKWSQPEVQFNESQENELTGTILNGGQKKNCGTLTNNKKYSDSSCKDEKPFICYDERNSSDFIYGEKKNWTDAQSFCRNNHTDLISGPKQIEKLDEGKIDTLLSDILKKDLIFIGLFRDSWQWSDGNRSSFRFWNLTYDDEVDDKSCAMLNEKGRWNSENCNKAHPFVCHDAQVSEQEDTAPTRTPGSTPVHEPTAPSSEQQNTTPTRTPGSTTVHESTAQTSEQQDITPTRTPGSTTAHESTAQVSEQQDTTPTRTPGSTTVHESTGTNPMILINKNRTWEEALYYCRHHYHDLVTITNPKEQRWVQKKASKASTPFVWTGLRYTCTLGFWFWVSGEVVRYKNWASPKQMNECDMSGAMERGGGHKWFKINDEKKLNFICSPS